MAEVVLISTGSDEFTLIVGDQVETFTRAELAELQETLAPHIAELLAREIAEETGS
jgi:hypothetical protein